MAPQLAAKIVAIITLLVSKSTAIVPLSDFFPFGLSNGDAAVEHGDDNSSPPVPISIAFPFFNISHTTLWVNTNGVMSLAEAIREFTPTCTPVTADYRMVTPFWSDVDTRLDTPSTDPTGDDSS